MPWRDITTTEQYQSLPPEQQIEQKRAYFRERVLPSIRTEPRLNVLTDDVLERVWLERPDDSGQDYFTSMLSSAGRGAASIVPGAVGGLGYLTGSETLQQAGEDIESGIEEFLPVNPAYEQDFAMKAAGAVGQAVGFFGTGGVGGLAGKALGGARAAGKLLSAAEEASVLAKAASNVGRALSAAEKSQVLKGAAVAKATKLGAETAGLGAGILGGVREGGQTAEQYGLEGTAAYLRALAGGAIEGASEKLLFGLGTETAAVRKLLGETLEKGAGGFAKDTLTEGAEEVAAQLGGNIATNVALGATGSEVEGPGLTEGLGEAFALGAVGGATFGTINALTGAYRPNALPDEIDAEQVGNDAFPEAQELINQAVPTIAETAGPVAAGAVLAEVNAAATVKSGVGETFAYPDDKQDKSGPEFISRPDLERAAQQRLDELRLKRDGVEEKRFPNGVLLFPRVEPQFLTYEDKAEIAFLEAQLEGGAEFDHAAVAQAYGKKLKTTEAGGRSTQPPVQQPPQAPVPSTVPPPPSPIIEGESTEALKAELQMRVNARATLDFGPEGNAQVDADIAALRAALGRSTQPPAPTAEVPIAGESVPAAEVQPTPPAAPEAPITPQPPAPSGTQFPTAQAPSQPTTADIARTAAEVARGERPPEVSEAAKKVIPQQEPPAPISLTPPEAEAKGEGMTSEKAPTYTIPADLQEQAILDARRLGTMREGLPRAKAMREFMDKYGVPTPVANEEQLQPYLQPQTPQPDAVQEPSPTEGVLRQEGPELELPRVAEQDTEEAAQGASAEAEVAARTLTDVADELASLPNSAPASRVVELAQELADRHTDPVLAEQDAVGVQDVLDSVYGKKSARAKELQKKLPPIIDRLRNLKPSPAPQAEPTTQTATLGTPTSRDVGTQRDLSKPEQMTPEEWVKASRSSFEIQSNQDRLFLSWFLEENVFGKSNEELVDHFTRLDSDSGIKILLEDEIRRRAEAGELNIFQIETEKSIRSARKLFDDVGGAESVELENTENLDETVVIAKSTTPKEDGGDFRATRLLRGNPVGHTAFRSFENAVASYGGVDADGPAYGKNGQYRVKRVRGYGRPVSAEAVDTYGITLPEGYVREGELYVYRPDAPQAPTPSPAPQAEPTTQTATLGEPTSRDVGVAPEQMTPGEYRAASRERFGPKGQEDDLYEGNTDEGIGKAMAWHERNRTLHNLGFDSGQVIRDLDAGVNPTHAAVIRGGVMSKQPVSAEAVDAYNIPLPEGYVRQGDLYVYQPDAPTTQAPTPEPAVPAEQAPEAAETAVADTYEGDATAVLGQKEAQRQYDAGKKWAADNLLQDAPKEYSQKFFEDKASLIAKKRPKRTQYSSSKKTHRDAAFWDGASRALSNWVKESSLESKRGRIREGKSVYTDDLDAEGRATLTPELEAAGYTFDTDKGLWKKTEAAPAPQYTEAELRRKVEEARAAGMDKETAQNELDEYLRAGNAPEAQNAALAFLRNLKKNNPKVYGGLAVAVNLPSSASVTELFDAHWDAFTTRSTDPVTADPQPKAKNVRPKPKSRNRYAAYGSILRTKVSTEDAQRAVELETDTPGLDGTMFGTLAELRDQASNNPGLLSALDTAEREDAEAFFWPDKDGNPVAVVIVDQMAVYSLDAALARQNGTTPAVEAVRRVLRHENVGHRGWGGLPQHLRDQWLAAADELMSPEDADDLVSKGYREFADWRTNDASKAGLFEEWVARQTENPVIFANALKRANKGTLRDLLRDLWNWLTGGNAELLDPSDEQLVQLVADLLTYAGRAPAGRVMKASYAGRRAIENLPEERRQFMRDSLATAEAMAAAGKSSEEIRAVTGWFPGKYDGKMRWEIPDEGATANPPGIERLRKGEEVPLQDVLRHQKLFAAYPSLRDVGVLMSSNNAYNERSDTILLRRGSGLGTLLHEIQHAIQRRESWPRGGTPSVGAWLNPEMREALLKVSQDTFKEMQIPAPYDTWLGGAEGTPELRKEYDNYVKDLKTPARLDRMWVMAQEGAASNLYPRLAGEIEARDVQARLSYTPEQRKAVAPYSSENIAPEDAIVLFGSRVAESRRALGTSLRDLMPQEAVPQTSIPDAYARAREGSSTAFISLGDILDQMSPGYPMAQFEQDIQQMVSDGSAILEPVNEVVEGMVTVRDPNTGQPGGWLYVPEQMRMSRRMPEAIPSNEGGDLPPSTWATLEKEGYSPEASEKTQITTTAATYEKIVRANAKEGMVVLDYAAGRGAGTKAAKDIGAREGFTVVGFEPFSNKSTRVIKPEFEGVGASSEIPAGSVDLVINNAVLNVVPESTGREIVRDIYSKLKPGGSAFINVMGWSNIKSRLNNPKTRLVGPREVITVKGTFQKGYTFDTLRELISGVVPEAVIERTSYGDVGLKVTKPETSVIRFSRRMPVSEEMAAEHMAAAEGGDTEKAQRLVNEAAKAAGMTERVVHFTPTKGFTEFDKSLSSGLFYFAYDPEYAQHFGRYKIEAFLDPGQKTLDARALGVEPITPEQFKTWMQEQGVYLSSNTREGLRGRYLSTDQKPFWHYLRTLSESGLVEDIKESGFSSVRQLEVAFGPVGDVMVVFDPNQIKSAEPVTYDDQGNVILLSQRFNPETPDIRFSRKMPDDRVGPLTAADEADDKAAARAALPKEITVVAIEDEGDLDEDGNPMPYYIIGLGSPEEVEQWVRDDAPRDLWAIGESDEQFTQAQVHDTLYEVTLSNLLPRKEIAAIPVRQHTVRITRGLKMSRRMPDEADARFDELTADLPDTLTQEDIDEWKAENPEKWAELSAMREEALKAAGYEVGWYHGTPRGGFTAFDPSQIGTGLGAYRGGFSFTTNRKAADTYAKSSGGETDVAAWFARKVNAVLRTLDPDSETASGGTVGEMEWDFGMIDTQDVEEIQDMVLDTANELSEDYPEAASQLRGLATTTPDTEKPMVMGVALKLVSPRVIKSTQATYGQDLAGVRASPNSPVLVDMGSEKVAFVADPNQIKSADPLSPGPKIPPSQWGLSSSDDIRFSRPDRSQRPTFLPEDIADKLSERAARYHEADPVTGKSRRKPKTPWASNLPIDPATGFPSRIEMERTKVDTIMNVAIDIVKDLGPPGENWWNFINNPIERRAIGITDDMMYPIYTEMENQLDPTDRSLDPLRFELERFQDTGPGGSSPAGTQLAIVKHIQTHPRYARLFAEKGMRSVKDNQIQGIVGRHINVPSAVQRVREADDAAQGEATDNVADEVALEWQLLEAGIDLQDPALREEILALNNDLIDRAYIEELLADKNLKASLSGRTPDQFAARRAALAKMDRKTLEAMKSQLDESIAKRMENISKMRTKAAPTRKGSKAKTVQEQAEDLLDRASKQQAKRKPAPNPVRDAYRDQLKRPTSREEFVKTLAGIGVDADTAGNLYDAAAAKRVALEMAAAKNSADAILNRLAVTHSDTQAWRKKAAANPVTELYNEHLKSKLPKPDFVGRMEKLGVDRTTAENIWSMGNTEREARRKVKDAKRPNKADEEKLNTAQKTARDILNRLAVSQSDTQAWPKKSAPNPMRDLYNRHMKTPVSLEEFVKEATDLGVAESEATNLWNVANRERRNRETVNKLTREDARRRSLLDLTPKTAPDRAASKPSTIRGLLSKAKSELLGRMNWDTLFNHPLGTQREWRQELFNKVRADEAFANLTDQEARDLAAELDRLWNEQRQKAVERDLKKLTPSGNEEVRNRVAKATPALLRAINRGTFNESTFRTAIAPKFGIGVLSDAEMQKVSELAAKAQDMSLTRPERKQAGIDMVELLQKNTDLTKAEVLSNWWVTSVLSGPRTLFDMAFNFLNGARIVSQFAVAAAATKKGGVKSAFRGFQDYMKGLYDGIQEAIAYIISGDDALLDSTERRLNAYFGEGSRAVPVDAWGKVMRDPKSNVLNSPAAYFFGTIQRMMIAFDHVTAVSTSEGLKSLAITLNPSIYGDAQLPDADDIAAAKETAKRVVAARLPEGANLDSFVNKRQVNAATRQILNDVYAKRFPRLLDDVQDIGMVASFQNDPTGLGGFIYHGLLNMNNRLASSAGKFKEKGAERRQSAQEKYYRDMEAKGVKNPPPYRASAEQWLREAVGTFMFFEAVNSRNQTGLRFVRFVGNKLNEMLSFLPGMGYLRWFEDVMDENPLQKQLLHTNQIVGGMTSAALAVALWKLAFDSDDEDEESPRFMINGPWNYVKNWEQKNRLRDVGSSPNSIEIRDEDGNLTVFNYTNWPLSGLLAAVGNLIDMKRFDRETWESYDTYKLLGAGLMSTGGAVFDMNALSAFTSIFLNRDTFGRDPVGGLGDRLAKWAANYAGGFIPRMAKDIDLWQEPTYNRPEDLKDLFWKEVPFFRRTKVEGEKALNMFGEPVRVERAPWSRAVVRREVEEHHKVARQLIDKGIFFSAPNPDVRTVQVPMSNERRPMDDNEAEVYVTEAGRLYKNFFTSEGERVLAMPRDVAKKYIDERLRVMRNQAFIKATMR